MKSARISVEVISILMVVLMGYQVIASGNDTNTTQNNDTVLSDNSEELTKDDYNCRKNKTFVWCVPLDYSNRKEPWRYKDIISPPAVFPWYYHFKFTIFDVEEVNDKDQTVRLRMYFNF